MSSIPPASLNLVEILRLLLTYRRRWLVPAVACTVLALGYALVMPRYWQASQAVVVRQEGTVSADHPGEFSDLYQMRTLQETILELAKSRQVVAATLQSVAKNEGRLLSTAPSESQIESLRKRLRMLPPQGAEFGKTEVFYLSIKDTDRQRAIRLVNELSRQLDRRLCELRNEQADSLISEFEKQQELALASHNAQTKQLAAFETQVGADLGELRMLQSASSGQSDLRQQVLTLQNESLKTKAQVQQSQQLLEVLKAAQREPEQIVAMPTTLLASQPTLQRVKEGLVEAQLTTARLIGTRTVNHPHVLAAMDSEQQVRSDLHDELQVVIDGVEVELALGRSWQAGLQTQLDGIQQRLSRLAEQRAEYSNHLSSVEESRAILAQAQQSLNKVQAARVATESASLVTLIDKPETGQYPQGPGRTTVVAAGGVAGLMLGLGLVFLTVSPTPAPSESRHSPSSYEASTLATAPVRETSPPQPSPAEYRSQVPRPSAAQPIGQRPIVPRSVEPLRTGSTNERPAWAEEATSVVPTARAISPPSPAPQPVAAAPRASVPPTEVADPEESISTATDMITETLATVYATPGSSDASAESSQPLQTASQVSGKENQVTGQDW